MVETAVLIGTFIVIALALATAYLEERNENL